MATHITIEPDWCHGAGWCTRIAPEVFTLDADGVVQLIGHPSATETGIAQTSVSACERAARECPAGCISLSAGGAS